MSRENNEPKKSRFRTARGWVALACVAFVLVGMAFHVGIGTPSAFGIQQISAICPLGALETMAGAKGVMLHPLLLFALVVVLIVLVGKAFCAWMCPVPWLQKFFRPKKRAASAKDAAGREATAQSAAGHDAPASCGDSAVGSTQAEAAEPEETHSACAPSACAACAGASACAKALAPVGGARDGVRLDSRHAVLVGTLASAAVFGFPVFCLICPVGLTFATIIGLWNLVQFNEPTWALIIFPIILIAEVTVLRKWCSKICPISALVSLLSNLNVTLHPRVKADACLRSRGVDCHACVDACPEQLDPHSRRIPECSKCGKCVEACPAKAIGIKLLK
ncbi:4Fe-4S binding protein [Senegalimassilia anaerobia]|uniref:4Fe-4S binding protein n=1 Tax=Senegalimassilia anaerobia TaxID=1473216 RepID=UPI00265F484B|nr:4Fe-4S binding protein [Senegalimassilia anaerobia]